MHAEDDDPYYDLDVIPGFRDADIEMAEAARYADRIEALRKRGVCGHGSAVAGLASGEVFYPEQEGLKPGQVACTEHTGGCVAVFDSDDAWDAARMAL